jgi:hypothetical protein
MEKIMEGWREFLSEDGDLNEAELKYSERLFDYFYRTALAHYKKGERRTGSTTVKLAGNEISEILYSDNKKIINGYAILYLIHFGGMKLDAMPFVKNNWDSQAGLKESLLSRFLKEGISLKFVVDSEGGMGSMGAGKNLIRLRINPWAHEKNGQLDEELMRSTVRHELQHLTQTINGLSLKYGEQLFALNGETSKMKKLSLNFEKEFGVGKQKTGLRQISKKQARERGIDDQEREKRYLGDDFEYETWMSDIIDDLIRWAFKKEYIKSSDLDAAAFKLRYPNILSEDKNADFRKLVIAIAKKSNRKPMEVINMWKKAPSFNDIAVKFAGEIMKNDTVLKMFAADTVGSYAKAVKTLLKLRPKEFAGDLVKNLELRLQKMSEKK